MTLHGPPNFITPISVSEFKIWVLASILMSIFKTEGILLGLFTHQKLHGGSIVRPLVVILSQYRQSINRPVDPRQVMPPMILLKGFLYQPARLF